MNNNNDVEKIIKTRAEVFGLIDNGNKSRVDPDYLLFIFQTNGNIWRVDLDNNKYALNKLKRLELNTPYRLIQTRNIYGYTTLFINGKNYRQHRLLWEIFNKQKIPFNKTIDHINQIKDDNCIDNLRLATHQEQNQNTSINKRRALIKSIYKGVHWHKRNKKWVAQICHPIEKTKNGKWGKLIHLGSFIIEEDARDAYITKAKEYNKEYGTVYSF